MKQTILFFTLSIFSLTGHCQKLSIKEMYSGDSVIINYSIATGEFGSIHKGILLRKESDRIRASHVLYNYGVSLLPNGVIDVALDSYIPMNEDSVKAFYMKFKNDFTVLKEEWTLNDAQISCLNKFLEEAGRFESQGFSNAPEYYHILINDWNLVVLDRSGKWDKHKYLQKALGIKASQ